ncbi:MAG: hypothetical protein ACOVMP_00035 [Chthoniobacterales bacterium]
MAHIFIPNAPTAPASRRRSLVRDVAALLRQQMFFWGCDASCRDGNLLVRYGMTRISEKKIGSEGSSRYRIEWGDGTVELHSYCAGWYSRCGEGVVYIRNRERLYACCGELPLTPGAYERDRHSAENADAMLSISRPMVRWISEYEDWVQSRTAPDYRRKCWKRLLSRVGDKPWLPPDLAAQWRDTFLTNPDSTPRAKEIMRRPVWKTGRISATPRDYFAL